MRENFYGKGNSAAIASTLGQKKGRPARQPSARNCAIYEQVRLEDQNTRHSRELAQSGIERVYFAVVDQLLFGIKIIE